MKIFFSRIRELNERAVKLKWTFVLLRTSFLRHQNTNCTKEDEQSWWPNDPLMNSPPYVCQLFIRVASNIPRPG